MRGRAKHPHGAGRDVIANPACTVQTPGPARVG